MKKISNSQTFDDFYQVMAERGGISEVLMEASVEVHEAIKGTIDEGVQMALWNIPPLVVNEETKEKIIKSQGGIQEMKSFLAYNAQWPQYQTDLEADE